MNDEQVQRVGSRVYVGIPRPYDGAMAAVVGDDFLLVVDGTSYAPFAADFVAQVESERGRRPRLLVLTHQHFDHFAGLAAFAEPIIATQLTERFLRAVDQAWLDENLAVWKADDMVIEDLLGEPALRPPSILIEGPVHLDLGGHVGGRASRRRSRAGPGRRAPARRGGPPGQRHDRQRPRPRLRRLGSRGLDRRARAVRRAAALDRRAGARSVSGPELLAHQADQVRARAGAAR